MAFNSTFSEKLLELFFENTNFANIGDATGIQGSSTAGLFQVGLIKSGGAEADYTGYDRVNQNRAGATWTISGGNLSNANDIDFPTNTGSSQTITGFKIYYGVGVGTYTTEVGEGTLSASVTVAVGETPQFPAGDLTITIS